ncbi:hypothetical protein BESB_015790 [Besnoitia besnoiti]|uniref:Uncharacterized protein n=1 Tax=Besnoitia besnoiti TaxID=94643 RepID=A0A2A9M7I1_BESBE|nr:hypothetical protein BESB_015790 [Besnoitia besnoiti]PFH32261.1 hypothetical protein BESB_015790 [Besnoitia besnoiti]
MRLSTTKSPAAGRTSSSSGWCRQAPEGEGFRKSTVRANVSLVVSSSSEAVAGLGQTTQRAPRQRKGLLRPRKQSLPEAAGSTPVILGAKPKKSIVPDRGPPPRENATWKKNDRSQSAIGGQRAANADTHQAAEDASCIDAKRGFHGVGSNSRRDNGRAQASSSLSRGRCGSPSSTAETYSGAPRKPPRSQAETCKLEDAKLADGIQPEAALDECCHDEDSTADWMDVISQAAAAGSTCLPHTSPSFFNDSAYRSIFSSIPLKPALVDMIEDSVQLLEQVMSRISSCPKTKEACEASGLRPKDFMIPAFEDSLLTRDRRRLHRRYLERIRESGKNLMRVLALREERLRADHESQMSAAQAELEKASPQQEGVNSADQLKTQQRPGSSREDRALPGLSTHLFTQTQDTHAINKQRHLQEKQKQVNSQSPLLGTDCTAETFGVNGGSPPTAKSLQQQVGNEQ